MSTAVFYHAGCPVCIGAEQQLLSVIDRNRVQVEVIHLGERPEKLGEAIGAGVKSVPALVIDGSVLHINFGASLADLQK